MRCTTDCFFCSTNSYKVLERVTLLSWAVCKCAHVCMLLFFISIQISASLINVSAWSCWSSLTQNSVCLQRGHKGAWNNVCFCFSFFVVFLPFTGKMVPSYSFHLNLYVSFHNLVRNSEWVSAFWWIFFCFWFTQRFISWWWITWIDCLISNSWKTCLYHHKYMHLYRYIHM